MNIGNQGRIIVVDDEILLCRIVNRIVESLGYEVTIITNSKDMIQSWKINHDCEIIICDVSLPDITGPNLIEKLNEIYPVPRTLYMSGWGNMSDTLEEEKYLEKPFTSTQLVMAIEDLMSK